ncbi:hypothetical protein QBC39DRAFT_1080 [Podospora conica]|nr:hypothetical protein QBC39DRAFT_1080 [Schizothecium conicum]
MSRPEPCAACRQLGPGWGAGRHHLPAFSFDLSSWVCWSRTSRSDGPDEEEVDGLVLGEGRAGAAALGSWLAGRDGGSSSWAKIHQSKPTPTGPVPYGPHGAQTFGRGSVAPSPRMRIGRHRSPGRTSRALLYRISVIFFSAGLQRQTNRYGWHRGERDSNVFRTAASSRFQRLGPGEASQRFRTMATATSEPRGRRAQRTGLRHDGRSRRQ